LANPVNESSADVDLWHRYDDAPRPTSTATSSAIETRRDEKSRDTVQRRNAWEDAFDEVFAEEEVFETV
jgi:hypothetical protein